MKEDTAVRPLTVKESDTNKAWEIYAAMTPVDRFSMSHKFQHIENINKRQTAIVNYIEDNMEEFV